MLQSNCSGYWTGHMMMGESAAPTTSLMPSSICLPPQVPPNHASTNYAPMQKRDERMQTGRPATLQLRRVSLRRSPGEGIGLSIVAAQGVGDKTVGIYVKKVVAGSPAHRDGRLESGDKLMSVNGRSLLGISQEEAAQRMISASQEVHFEVAKGAAIFNGLDAWLKAETPSLDHQKRDTLSMGVNGGTQPPQQLLRHNRSISASELYSQADTVSLASLNSQQLPSYGHNKYGHGARLPPHYKMGSRQPAFVLQPSRPSPSPVNVHPTHSYGMRMIPNGNDYLRHPAGVFSRQQYRSASTVPMPQGAAPMLDHYSNLPLISKRSPNNGGQQHAPMINAGSGVHRSQLAPYRDGEENASLNSSTNSSGGNEVGAATGAAGTLSSNKPDLAYNEKHHDAPLADSSGARVRQLRVSSALPPSSSSSSSSSNQPPQSRRTHQRVPAFIRIDEGEKGSAWSSAQPTQHLSGRSSAPLFGAVNYNQQAETKLSEMSAQQLNEELDRLDAKDSMTAADKSRYRQILELMERVQRGTALLATSRSETDFPHRRVHSEDRHGVPLETEEVGPTRPTMLTKAKGPNFILPYMSEMESKLLETKRKRAAEGFNGVGTAQHQSQPKCHIESAIDDVSSVASRLHNAVSLVGSPDRPKQVDSDDALPAAKQREAASVCETRGSRRRVQFREYSDQLVRAEDHAHTGCGSSSSTNGGCVDYFPSSAQVVSGPSEIYNDPRQRRLLEREERASKQLRSTVDGACLGFRDKMKLFAAKLGEQPNNPPPVVNQQEYCGRAKTSV